MKKPDPIDIAGVAGLVLITRGGWEIYPPLAWVLPGLALVTIAAMAARRG